MSVSVDVPRAEELRLPRRASGGRRYIGPKIQVNVPAEQYDFAIDYMEANGLEYADALREVFAAGVAALRGAR